MEALVPYDVTDATLVSSTVAETDNSAWVSGTTYAVGDRRIRTTTHSIYERLIAGAGTAAPEDDEINWLRVSATNRWKMFDVDPGSRTTGASPLTVVVSVTGAWADVVLLGVTGTTVTVTATGVNKSVSVPAETIAGQGSTVVIGGMAGVAGNVTVSVTGTGTLAVGQMSIGTWTWCGDTQKGVELSGQDYTRTTWDAWGNLEIVPGAQARRLVTPITLPKSSRDQVARVLTALRSKPCMWRGVSWLGATVVWGWMREPTMRGDAGPLVTGSVTVNGLAIGL